MHLITLTKPVDTVIFGVLEPGEWIVHDRNAWEIGMLAEWGSMKAKPFSKKDSTFGAILIARSGAWGDLLLLSPAIRDLKLKGHEVWLCCGKDKQAAFHGLVDGFVSYPLKKSEADRFPEILSCEEILENNPDKHATDAFAEKLGVTVTDYKPYYSPITEAEKESARLHFTSDRPRVAAQMLSSSANRNYPLMKWAEVILKLQANGWEVVLLGLKGQVPSFPKHIYQQFIHNLAEKNLAFRESAAVLSLCDAFVGVDSAFIHLCHALDIPAVGLYGPFKWQSRTAKAPKTFSLSGEGECKGCSWHTRDRQQFPPNKPCTKIQKCIVLDSIPVDRIVAEVEKLKP